MAKKQKRQVGCDNVDWLGGRIESTNPHSSFSSNSKRSIFKSENYLLETNK